MWQQWLPPSGDSTTSTSPIQPFIKALAAKLPQLTADMTCPWFKKFKTDWHVFKQITNIPEQQIHVNLCNGCDGHVQNSLLNYHKINY